MAKATAAKPATKKSTPAAKPARAPRVRKTEEQQLAEALAKVEALQARTAEKGEKKTQATQTALDEVLQDASKLPDFRAAGVEFGKAVKAADALGAIPIDDAAAEPGMREAVVEDDDFEA